MQLYSHAVSWRIGLGKLSTLPSVSDFGREEGGDCGREKNASCIKPEAEYDSVIYHHMLMAEQTLKLERQHNQVQISIWPWHQCKINKRKSEP